jgi:hypothetical protein
MRNLIKNKTKMFVLNYKGETDVVDDDGYLTGEKTITYSKPITFDAHKSSARGSSQVEMFGTDIAYDITIVISKSEFNKLQITENSVFFIDTIPQYDGDTPLYDHRVSRIAETINEVAIALTRVDK